MMMNKEQTHELVAAKLFFDESEVVMVMVLNSLKYPKRQ